MALEESNRRTLLGLMSSASGKSLHLGEHDPKTLATIYDNTVANWDLFLFDGFGSYDPDIIYNRIEYLATGLETRVVFLDHLSILLSGLEGDERRMIDTTMTKLRSLVERTGIALFLVSHLKRTQSDKTMKREHVLHWDSLEEVHQLRNFLTLSLHSNVINKTDLNTAIQLCESLKIAIQARQALLAD